MTPHRGNTVLFRSSQHFPSLRLLRCLRDYTETRPPAGMPLLARRTQDTFKKQLTQTLIVRLLKTHFLTLLLDCEKSTE